MRIVTTNETRRVAVEKGRNVITLQAGSAYIMHDVEVASGQAAGVWSNVQTLPKNPIQLVCNQSTLAQATGRMILPFIGGLGDALSMLPVIASIRDQNAGLVVDVAATPGPADVFRLSPQVHAVHDYPLTRADWSQYDHYVTMEAVHQTAQQPGRALPEVFADSLGLSLTVHDTELQLPAEVEQIADTPNDPPLVVIGVGEGSALRAYPVSKLRILIEHLAKRGYASVLLGRTDAQWSVPECPPLLTDMRDQTPTLLHLIVWLRAADVVIAHDSFIMHLAGAMGRPTVALFAPTASAHAAPYQTVVTRQSKVECAPCHAAGETCPLGFDCCIAWDDDAVAPEQVVEQVLELMTRSVELAESG